MLKGDGPSDPTETRLLAECRASGRPVVLALNKVDRVRDKPALLPVLQTLVGTRPLRRARPDLRHPGPGVDDLVGELLSVLPVGPPLTIPTCSPIAASGSWPPS